MAKLIIITGDPAAMKSTISKRLSADLNVACFNKDDIKEILGDMVGFSDRHENIRLSNATFAILKETVEQFLSQNLSIIIESNFKPYELESLKELPELKGHQALTIALSGSPEVLFKRYLEREPSRHFVHKSVSFSSVESFARAMIDYQGSDFVGKVLKVDTTVFEEKSYQAILKSVRHFMAE
jgi:predicted kinase